jgi:heme-degrading monooxygenase HmoA
VIYVLAEIEVEDFGRFLENFNTRGLRLRRRHGSHGARVLRHRDDPERVSVLFEWESEEAFRGFVKDPDVRESVRLGGAIGPPQIVFVDAVEELPH